MNENFLNNKWHLIIINDPDFLSGESILNILKDILTVHSFKFVVLDYIYGALISSLVKVEKDIIEINKLVELLPEVQQFDWGDFFLFSEYPKNWSNNKKMLYPAILTQTDSAIRAVDDQYIYIYTPKEDIANFIKAKYKIESIHYDFLINLSYPD